MAAPSFRSAGSWSFTANNAPAAPTLSPGAPAGVQPGDLLILVTESRGIGGSCSTPSGWNLVSGFPLKSATASGGQIYAFTRIADGSAADTPSVSWSGNTSGTTGDSTGAGILCYQNGTEVLDVAAVATDLSAQTTTSVISGVTTATGNDLVLVIAMKIIDSSAAQSVSAGWTERVDAATTSGTGHMLEIAEKIQAAPGATGSATVTWGTTTSARAFGVAIALQGTPVRITPAEIGATSTVSGRVTGPRRAIPATVNATATVSLGGSGSPTLNAWAGAAANAAGGDGPWTGLSNVIGPDDLVTATGNSVHLNNEQTDRVDLTQFGLATGTPLGVVISIIGWCSFSTGSPTWHVRLLYNGSPIGNEKTAAVPRTTGDGISLGGPSDLWGATLTPAMLADPSFGVRLYAEDFGEDMTYHLDAVEILITDAGDYVAPGGIILARLLSGVISATSSVSGGITGGSGGGGTKAITPATVNATSTLSGNLVALRRILPGGISATSTVSGSLRAIRAIRPGAVQATSTLSGNVTARHAISGAVAATSTVTGTVIRGRGIFPATVAATSTVTGKVVALRRIAGAVSATSTVSGSLAALRRVSGAISATSTVSGSLRVIRAIRPATVTATSTLSGSLGVRRGILPTQISATSTVTGSIVARRRIAPAQVSATSTVTGVLTKLGQRLIVPTQVLATSTVSGSLSVRRRIPVQTISATSTLSGSLRVIRRVVPAGIMATSTVTGSIRRLRSFPGIVTAQSTVSGKVSRVVSLPGQVSATSTISSVITVIRVIPPDQISALSIVTGQITGRPAILPLRGFTPRLVGTVWETPIVERVRYGG